MEAINQFLADEGQEKFEEARKLNDEESLNDPETDPYKSKYKAREILCELKETVEKYQKEDPESERCKFLINFINFKLGCNYSETEELASGEEHLRKAEEGLAENKLDKHVCGLYVSILNQLGILWTGRRQYEKALGLLQQAESVYKKYKHEMGGTPHMCSELLEPETEEQADNIMSKRDDEFEDLYTHSLYYLAQVYGKLEESQKSAEYCHVTLHRQLDTMKYTPMDWALNCATLSQYYLTTENFKMSRHCMAAASYILKELGDPTICAPASEDEGQTEIDQRERLPRAYNDMCRCWAKYGLAVLETSMEKQLKDANLDDDHNYDINQDQKEKEDDEKKKKESEREGASESDDSEKSPLFFNLELTAIEERITDKHLDNFEQARDVFLVVQKWLNTAKEFYALDEHCTDYIEIIQDLSRAFKFLCFFEPSFERQCKMHKRRADLLIALLKELNPQFYLLVCRQLMFEIAEIYSSMLDLKLAIIEEEGVPPVAHAVKKINQLAEQSIAKYHEYIDSLKTPDKTLPDQFAMDDERPALIAHFCTGRLYSKLIDTDIRKRLSNINQSIIHYKFLVDYCKRNPSAVARVKAERDICEEMVLLLPAKMERISANAEF